MKILLVIIIILALVCLISCVIDTHRFVVRNYRIADERIRRDMRFVLLCDLHNKEYGQDNAKLIEAIDAQSPDAILIAGDMPNALKGHDPSPAVNLLKDLAAKYPIYYGFGNHEYRLRIYPNTYGDMWDRYKASLDDIGVHIMDNETVGIEGSGISISALTMDRKFYKRFGGERLKEDDVRDYLGERGSDDDYRILIAHDPEYFPEYAKWGADLTVSGHVHGGIMRLPFVGGIVSPRLIRLPRYSDGEYNIDSHKIIVSCGLGTHTIHVRVFNPAELSVIDLVKKEN